MASKYDKPLTITVTADDWRAARAEERFQERIQQRLESFYDWDSKAEELHSQEKDYSCICVVAQALVRQIPQSTRSGVKNAISVNTSSCYVKFRDGTKREYSIDDIGQKIIDRFDSKVNGPKGTKVRAPMPAYLRDGVEVTLTPRGNIEHW